MKLVYIPFNFVHIYWDKLSHFIESGLKYSEGDFTIDQVKVYLADNKWVLIGVFNEEEVATGALVVSITNSPNSRTAFVISIGGKLISNEDTYNQLVSIVKQFGATKIQGAGRPSIVRLWKRLGFKERYTIVENKI
jgi:hypothetical protein